ncbi:MAG: hypothetical protein HZB38_01625 [Planctomycetes bacterium]|nr:hypothetical protein [Planctomycetota bacterium]
MFQLSRQFRSIVAVATSLGVLAGSAWSQCSPPATTNGADVVVGDIQGVANYSSAGGIEAFALGSYSCNIGNVWLNWIASTNQHPVIAQNLFKAKQQPGGYWTMEQLGQAWLKHGFYALSNTLCCTGCSATDGSHLGVHCSDPYTASRNGGQSGAGPKWQVNPYTGYFPYPPANPPWSGTVARRLQARITDLEANSATVKYYSEVQYICADEAAANRVNNCSYRESTMTGSGSAWSIGATATTQRGKPGIMAWQAVDPSVIVKEFDIPSDGRIVAAARIVDLGNNTWHYEYAIQNLNSDRCVQAISFAKSAALQVTNIGFRDVDYHDLDGIPTNPSQPNTTGRNYDGTDWTPTVTASTLSWATATYDSGPDGPNANALRWGTMYNFRFDANAGPVFGSGPEAALFKPGTPTSITLTGIPVPGTPATRPGDLNGDGLIDLADLTLMLSAFGSCTGDPNFLAAADIDGSGCVELADLTQLLSVFGT